MRLPAAVWYSLPDVQRDKKAPSARRLIKEGPTFAKSGESDSLENLV